MRRYSLGTNTPAMETATMTDLSAKINNYFELMEEIRAALFRVMPVSDRYLCIVSFSTQLQALQCTLVSKTSLMEVKLIEGLTGQELATFGTIMQKVEGWAANNMQGTFPLDNDKDAYAEYKALTRDEPEAEPEDEDDRGLTVAEKLLAMSRPAALEELDDMGYITMQGVASDWKIDSTIQEEALRSLLKGYILRSDT